MDIPFVIFALYTAIALTIGIIGIIMGIKKINGSPFITVVAGFMFLIQVILIESIEVDYKETETQNIDIQEIYHVHDWNFEFAVRSGGIIAIGQEITAGSDLISTSFFDRLDCIQLPLYKTGNPTGNATIAVFDQSVNVKYPFGTIDVSTLTTTFDWYEFCLPTPEHHFIEANDVIGIKYSGGNATNFIVIKTDSNAGISGSLVNTATGVTWTDSATRDMTMVLYNKAVIEEHIITPITSPFNTYDTWVFTIMLGLIFIFIGVMLQFTKW